MKFAVSYEGFPSYRGLIRFSCGLGGGFFLKLKGNIIQTLPLEFVQLAVSVS